MHTIIITTDAANGSRFRPLAAGQGLGAKYGRHSPGGFRLSKACLVSSAWDCHPRSNDLGPCLLGFSLERDTRCEYQAKDSSEAAKCQAIVEMPRCLGKSKGAVSLQ